jgi:glucose-6-phosphate isomerase
MLQNNHRKPLRTEKSWQKLSDLYEKHGSSLSMKQMFAQDGDKRFAHLSHVLNTPDGDILFDLSKNLINDEILTTLIELVRPLAVPNHFKS